MEWSILDSFDAFWLLVQYYNKISVGVLGLRKEKESSGKAYQAHNWEHVADEWKFQSLLREWDYISFAWVSVNQLLRGYLGKGGMWEDRFHV